MSKSDIQTAAETFGKSLTMAETAYIESMTGDSLAEGGDVAASIGMVLVSAKRLGYELTVEEAKMFNYTQVEQLINQASTVPPKVDSENVNNLLALITGK